jgi:thiamine biosynthesis lipoprotein
MKTLRVAALVAVASLAGSLSAQEPETYHHQATRMSMACAYAIDAYGPRPDTLPRILEEALDEVDRIDRLMSHYKPESALSRINREAANGPVKVEKELFDFIAEAMGYARASAGAFDITVGPLMKAWGFFKGEGRVPDAAQLEAARRHVGSDHVTLNAADSTVRFDHAGVELDLGGIAKGYAVDRVVRLLRSRGVTAALVSAGGSTTYGLGAPPGRSGWDVALEDPTDPAKTALTFQLKDRSLSVSGRSGKSFEVEGVVYSHIMNPRTGMPVQGMLTVAVLSPTGTAGDALDDAFFVLGPKDSRRLLKEHAGVEAFYFLPAGGRGWRIVHARE